MKILSFVILCLGLVACAGTEGDIEEARLLLAKGGKSRADDAISLLTPLLTSTSGVERLEVYRLYAGAKMASAGFDSTKIIPALAYTGDDNLLTACLGSVTDLATDSASKMSDAISALVEITGSTDLAKGDVRAQKGLYFQLGLAYFLDAIRVYLSVSGLASGTTVDCTVGGELDLQRTAAKANLNNSYSTLTATDTGAGYSASNDFVSGLASVRDDIVAADSSLTTLCDYLNGLN